MAALKDQLARGDFVEARRTAHSLKGSALNVGAIQLAYAVREIEDACRSGDASHAATRLPGAGQDYKVTFEAFDAHFARRA
jgi:HPt (histidine-containing phosphotransfer) domain-containing protein